MTLQEGCKITKPGVFAILNTEQKKYYIGHSAHIGNYFKRILERKTSIAPAVQRDLLTLGPSAFSVIVLSTDSIFSAHSTEAFVQFHKIQSAFPYKYSLKTWKLYTKSNDYLELLPSVFTLKDVEALYKKLDKPRPLYEAIRRINVWKFRKRIKEISERKYKKCPPDTRKIPNIKSDFKMLKDKRTLVTKEKISLLDHLMIKLLKLWVN